MQFVPESATVGAVKPTEEQRFWAKVDKLGADECWHWTGATVKNGPKHCGYGRFGAKSATQYVLALDGRPRPRDGMLALHSCNNPICVNPAHLRWGTVYENTLDAVANGTKARAISDEEAEAIRNDPGTNTEIARAYNCSAVSVSLIKRGKSHNRKVYA